MDKRWTWAGAAVIVFAFVFWLLKEDAVEASDLRRSLASARFDQDPFGMPLPPAWEAELRAAIARAPEVSLLDPGVPETAAEIFRSVSWVHPDTVKARLQIPDGVQIEYLPRQARFLLVQRGTPVGVLSADGCLLPPGLPPEVLLSLIQLELEPEDKLPAPGRPISSRIAQEALRAFYEIVEIEEVAEIRVVRVRAMREGGQPIRSTAPGLRWVLDDGREIDWGRSDLSKTADEPAAEHKAARLGAVMRQYPRLAGVQAVVLHHSRETLVLDQAYRQLPFDGVVLRPR